MTGGARVSRAVLTVAAVARRLGIAPATLRTWDRRYGLGPSEHRAGAHRRYTEGDLARLSLMRRLTLEGVPPAEAARLAISAPKEEAQVALGAPPPGTAGIYGAGWGRAGGGRIVALPHGGPAARGLARAAMSLDSAACVEILAADLESRGVIETWEELLVPVLAAVGERWAVTGQGIDVEHLLSESVLTVLRAVRVKAGAAAAGGPDRFALLACVENEQHSLPVHVLAAALAERAVPARVLGGSVPREALAAAVRRSGPAAVFLWSQLAATGEPDQLEGLPALRPAPRVVVGGPGWDLDRVPVGVNVARTLLEAVEQVLVAAAR